MMSDVEKLKNNKAQQFVGRYIVNCSMFFVPLHGFMK